MKFKYAIENRVLYDPQVTGLKKHSKVYKVVKQFFETDGVRKFVQYAIVPEEYVELLAANAAMKVREDQLEKVC